MRGYLFKIGIIFGLRYFSVSCFYKTPYYGGGDEVNKEEEEEYADIRASVGEADDGELAAKKQGNATTKEVIDERMATRE